MIYEKSCGAVVFTKICGETKYLLVTNLDGVYGFPKGHIEMDETEIETALREVFEETNLKIRLIDGFSMSDEYPIPKTENTIKHVTYFLGSFDNQKVIYNKRELSGACLVSYKQATELLQFEKLRHILECADNYLQNADFFKRFL